MVVKVHCGTVLGNAFSTWRQIYPPKQSHNVLWQPSRPGLTRNLKVANRTHTLFVKKKGPSLKFTFTMGHNMVSIPTCKRQTSCRAWPLFAICFPYLTSYCWLSSTLNSCYCSLCCCLHELRIVRGDQCFSIHLCWKGTTPKSTSVLTEELLSQRTTSKRTG